MNSVKPMPAQGAFETTYRIGELAAEFGVTLRTLRFYEDKGLLEPRRIGNTRLYSRGDRARLKLVLLGKRVGFSLHDIREMLSLYEPGGDNRRQLRVASERGDEQLARLHGERAALDQAIDELETALRHIRTLVAERG